MKSPNNSRLPPQQAAALELSCLLIELLRSDSYQEHPIPNLTNVCVSEMNPGFKVGGNNSSVCGCDRNESGGLIQPSCPRSKVLHEITVSILGSRVQICSPQTMPGLPAFTHTALHAHSYPCFIQWGGGYTPVSSKGMEEGIPVSSKRLVGVSQFYPKGWLSVPLFHPRG